MDSILSALSRSPTIARAVCGASFGIGTNFSNDVGNGVRPMNIVMKLWKCKMTEKERWNPCVKLSDVDGKHTGEPEEIELAQRTLGLPVQI